MTGPLRFHVNGRQVEVGAPPSVAVDAGAARSSRADRDQGWLRRRRLRCMHGAARRCAGLRLPGATGPGTRPLRHHRRRAGRRQRTQPAAAGVPRTRRGPVRDLHTGNADGREHPARPCAASDRAGGARCARRRALQVHRIPEDRAGGACGDESRDDRARRPERAAAEPDSRNPHNPRNPQAEPAEPATRTGARGLRVSCRPSRANRGASPPQRGRHRKGHRTGSLRRR